jgi:hypothetical protein
LFPYLTLGHLASTDADETAGTRYLLGLGVVRCLDSAANVVRLSQREWSRHGAISWQLTIPMEAKHCSSMELIRVVYIEQLTFIDRLEESK